MLWNILHTYYSIDVKMWLFRCHSTDQYADELWLHLRDVLTIHYSVYPCSSVRCTGTGHIAWSSLYRYNIMVLKNILDKIDWKPKHKINISNTTWHKNEHISWHVVFAIRCFTRCLKRHIRQEVQTHFFDFFFLYFQTEFEGCIHILFIFCNNHDHVAVAWSYCIGFSF